MNRRAAATVMTLAALSSLALAACSEGSPSAGGASRLAAPPGAYDWWIAGGTVIDGTGAPGRQADVLLRDGRISFVGTIGGDRNAGVAARHRFDAAGLVVAPGFIDAHAHGDPVERPAFGNFLAMGVTTVVLGQDGASPPAAEMDAVMDAVDAAHPGVNVAWLVGHATIREEAGVGFDAPGTDGLQRMSELVQQGLNAGAFGLSTGLEYEPGGRAEATELTAVARPVAAAGGVVASHVRTEDAGRVEAALEELLEQGRRSGARVHVAHVKIVLGDDPAEAEALLARMARARAEGVEVTADVYPYTASYTGLSILFPAWALPPADYAEIVRERRGELAAYLRGRVESRNGPEATLFGSGDYAGRTLGEVAAEQERPYEDVLIELGPGGASAAYFVMDEQVMRRFLADPHVVVSTDGSPTMLHPRGYGSFPRVIRRYAVESRILTLEAAVRKMTGLTASIYRLDDSTLVGVPRGQLQDGWAGDVVAFDPEELRDRADFEHPHRLADGMRAVWIGGELVLRDGTPLAGPGHGRTIRARR
jgi:N-acyl-D-aspartate/D-glutamate deacylase